MRRTLWVVNILAVAAVTAAAGVSNVYYGGMEDTAGSSGYESNGDFNDMVWNMSGDLSLGGPGGTLLANPAVNETHSMFWDNKSLDGALMNVGYCLYGGGNCTTPGGPPPLLDAWATSTGGQVLDSVFTANGAITATLLDKITAYYTTDEIGWYDPLNGHGGTIFNGLVMPGTTVTFTPDSTFVLWTDHGSTTQRFYSNTSLGADSGQTHFALFYQDPGQNSPEPGTLGLLLPGLALIGLGLRKVRV